MRPDSIALLRCPECGVGSLAFAGSRANGDCLDGHLSCTACQAVWPVQGGMPHLFKDDAVQGPDRMMRFLYDAFHRWHDPAVDHLLPLMDGVASSELRDGYIRRLDLDSLRSAPGGPVRILEVGVGAGANLALLRRDTTGQNVEIWGLDLSQGMLRESRRKVRKHAYSEVRLLMADAHALPFADNTFDRVFHVGGIGAFRDPPAALVEMARVAKAETPIVVVDEQLDAARTNTLYHRAMFRLLTWYDSDPRSPRADLPVGAMDIFEEQVSRFYYCLSFKMPARDFARGAEQ